MFAILYGCVYTHAFPLHTRGFDITYYTMESFQIDACVRGYHHYKNVWSAVEGEMLQCVREPGNTTDFYVVAVMKGNMVVGHVPRIISSACSLFLKKQGTISSTITGLRQYSRDLPQGGLEVPSTLTFHGDLPSIFKLKKLLSKLSLPWSNSSSTSNSLARSEVDETSNKKQKLEQSKNPVVVCDDDNHIHSSEIWLCRERYVLRMTDRYNIVSGAQLTDRHIDFSQLILKEQFQSIHGFQSTLLLANKPAPVTNKTNCLQIMHCRNNHWITVSTIGCTTTNTVHVYDSLYFSVDNVTMNLLRILFWR